MIVKLCDHELAAARSQSGQTELGRKKKTLWGSFKKKKRKLGHEIGPLGKTFIYIYSKKSPY